MLYAVITVLFILLIILMLVAKRSDNTEEFTSTMSDKDLEDNVKRLAISLRSGELVGSIPNINAHLGVIKRAYKTLLDKVDKNQSLYECERWLYENYYSVTINVKQSDYKVFSKLTHKKNNVRIIQLARFMVASSNCNLSDDNIRRTVDVFNDYTPLHYEETLNLDKALVYALIERIAKLAKEIISTEKLRKQANGDEEPVRRLCKYDAYLYFFKHSGKYLDEKYFYKINDINPDNIDMSFANNLVDMSVLISNCISSLKRLDDIFSDEFRIELSSTYSIISHDETYKNMDMCSKFAYLSAISKLSTLYGASERSVAKSAMELAKLYNVHFGEIIYDYRYAIKGYIHSITPSVLKKPTSKVDQRLYATVVSLLSILLTGISIIFLDTWQMKLAVGLIMPFASIPVARFAVSLIVDRILPARNVASMNYINIPDEGRTLVVKNEFIANADQAEEACNGLLALASANKDDMIEYSLLVDLKSSESEKDSSDEEIIKKFEGLSKYSNINIFVRKRKYISGKWQAYERKRGATDALNYALINSDFSEFSFVLRPQNKPKFVLLLDDDNTLLPGGIKRAINTMLHPLNSKYTLMTFSSKYRLSSIDTVWSKSYKSDSGVDGYCNYGDFYYKISGNAIYCGKGIYRLEEYAKQLQGQLPDNRILSHDIIEGAIVPTGSLALPTYEDAPKSFVSHNIRQNRWERGDILLIPYIFSKKISQPFYRYVIAYNALKTALPILQFALLIMLFVSKNLLLLIPFGISAIAIWLIRFGLCLNALGYDKRPRYVFKQFVEEFAQMDYQLIMLPYYAASSALLWCKMLFKCVLDRKNLLEWKTFYSSQRQNNYSKHVQILLPSIILCIVLGGIFYSNIYLLIYFASFILLSNLLYFTSKKVEKEKNLSTVDKSFLLDIAERTCKYFESNLQNNNLICDNYQVFPKKGANGFTSPTNMGFAMLSYICSYKLGRLTLEECINKLEEQVSVSENLEKYKGHLFNWYSLATNKPLSPYFVSSVDSGNFIASLITVKQFVKGTDENLYERIQNLLNEVDFDALYDGVKGKFHIGYNKLEQKFEGHYDMLASESRTLCYIASALKGDTRYWNGLARNIAKINGNTLISWSGTAFEYLMPQIFLSDCSDSLLTSSIKNVVKIMEKAKCSGVWGISESCYYEFNEENNYKYSAFGVSSISLSAVKDRCVISPYSSALALKYAPDKAVRNLRNLADEGMLTHQGMFESVDYTNGKNIVATLMSHHQGMILCSIVNTLFDNYLVSLFMSDEAMSGARLMLEEQIPTSRSKSTKKFDFVYKNAAVNNYRVYGAGEGFPKVNAISNGQYSCIIDSYGNGYSFAKGKYLNKPPLELNENKGGFFYVCDDSALYSPTFAPFNRDKCEYEFTPYESIFTNVEKDCKMSVYIPQNSNCEIRKITICNNEDRAKTYKCGYCEEIALTDFGATFSHPAFNDMFVSTRFDESRSALIAKRTARSFSGDSYLSLNILGMDKYEYESNLFNFIGRERTFSNPIIFENVKKEGVSIGDVLNPCLGFVGEITLQPHSEREVYCIKFYDNDLKSLESNIEQSRMIDFAKYSYESARLTMLSKTYKYQVNEKISELICKIASNVLYKPYDREKLMAIADDYQDNLPIGLSKNIKYIYFEHYSHDEALKNLIYATIYLNMASVKCNLVIAYRADDQNNENVLKSFIDLTNIGDILQLECIKFLRLNGIDGGVLERIKINAFEVIDNPPKKGEINSVDKNYFAVPQLEYSEKRARKSLVYSQMESNIVKHCACGGFDKDGDYIITKIPSLPYSNVICAEKGGFVVTQNGGGFDYFENSNLNRITKWENNPVFDSPCEEVYIDIDGMRRINKLVEGGYVRHSRGFTEFCGSMDGVDYSVKESLVKDGAGKVVSVKLSKTKDSINTKLLFKLNAMLGDLPYMQMIYDEQLSDNIVKITNAFNNKRVYIKTNVECSLIPDKTCLMSVDKDINLGEGKCGFYFPSHSLLTRNLSGKRIEINIVISTDYKFINELNVDNIQPLIFEQTNNFSQLNKFELRSKDEDLNIFFNKWLAYQVVSSRINGKCGYYQSGGAIGFRDQLQDMLTMLYIDPEKVKKHILLCAEHQYLEGDVQHWWHGECFGVRTQITDDKLFLAFLTFEYIDFTGDKDILNSVQKYLISPPLEQNQESRLENPSRSNMGESLYTHIKRAIDSSLKFGKDGLLLIGGGDWNDALNEIGMRQRGESVWLSMFAVHVLRKFVQYTDFDQRQIYLAHIENLTSALERAFKDGYFMRAVTDYGEELGVAKCKHFSKDLLCQSWSVIANISSKQNQRSAVRSAAELIDCNTGIIKLLTPAQTKDNYYGYISSYPQGVRENGGQYTHAAAWYVKAVAMLDEKICVGDRILDAHDLLNILNPIRKNANDEKAAIYKGEPYVLSGDVYSNADNYGRSGWSWYTGSASILYDTIIRDFLGINICGKKMTLSRPHLQDWQDMRLIYRYKGTVYIINYAEGKEDCVKVDGISYKGDLSFVLKEDLGKRDIEVTFK